MSATAKGSSLEELICPEPWGRPPGAWCARLASRLALLCGGLSRGLDLPSLVAEIHTGKCVWIPSWDPRSIPVGKHILHYPPCPPLLGQPGGTYVRVCAPLCGDGCVYVCGKECLGMCVHAYLYECDMNMYLRVNVCLCL